MCIPWSEPQRLNPTSKNDVPSEPKSRLKWAFDVPGLFPAVEDFQLWRTWQQRGTGGQARHPAVVCLAHNEDGTNWQWRDGRETKGTRREERRCSPPTKRVCKIRELQQAKCYLTWDADFKWFESEDPLKPQHRCLMAWHINTWTKHHERMNCMKTVHEKLWLEAICQWRLPQQGSQGIGNASNRSKVRADFVGRSSWNQQTLVEWDRRHAGHAGHAVSWKLVRQALPALGKDRSNEVSWTFMKYLRLQVVRICSGSRIQFRSLDLAGYDVQMVGWGGENLDQSLRQGLQRGNLKCKQPGTTSHGGSG